MQKTCVAVLFFILSWSLFATGHVVLRREIIESKNQKILALESSLEQKAQDLNTVRNEILERTKYLERRQDFLSALIDLDPTGNFKSNQSSNASEEVNKEDQKTSLNLRNEFSYSVLAESNLDDDNSKEFQQEISLRLTNISNTQDNFADNLTYFAHRKLSELNELLLPFKLKASDLTHPLNPEQKFSSQGGPFIPLTKNNTLISGSSFSALQIAWSEMLSAYTGLLSLPLDMPLDEFYISSHFGKRTDPLTKEPSWHSGVDLVGKSGTKIHAPNAGTVKRVGRFGSYGKMVEIDHGNGFLTRFGHLRKITVTAGQVLKTGAVIGEMGCTGRCTGTHLHYEVVFNGKIRNPQPFMEASDYVQQKQRQTAAHKR